nr:hypothetical protein [Cytophagales bacterium]
MKKLIVSLLLSFAIFPFVLASDFNIENSSLRISIDEKGFITSLYDKVHSKEYLLEGTAAPFMSLRGNGVTEAPSKAVYSEGLITFSFATDAVKATVKFVAYPSHLSFELVELTKEEALDLVLWGPYPTIIRETIGESVGVVRDGNYAIGIQALNVKTLGGYPSEENDVEPAYDIFETGDLVDVTSEWRNKKFYRGQTAKVLDGGSALQAYTRNRTKERIIANWGHDRYVAPAFEDGGLVGSKIALFGCPAKDALETIGEIELIEGLPHPLLDGQWAKTNKAATASYLIMGFNGENLEKALELTKKAGLEYLYHGGPFKTWGHFQMHEEAFPDNWASMKTYVDIAHRHGIRLGVHTLSNFISTNDPYVSPIPDNRLAKVGSGKLVVGIDSDATELVIDSPEFFDQMKNNTLQAAVVGNEIIRYRALTNEESGTLTGVVRGAFGTTASAHEAGTPVGKLMDHGYKVFLSNAELSIEIAETLADLFNKTGLRQISFDGLEGVWSTGMGQYARSLFTKTWYDRLNPELQGQVINDASNPSHFNWHINTRYNWGEPWYAGFRESQTNYRLMNQDFYRRNLLPSMLGWFSMSDQTSIEDTEWLLARAAGFDAGFAFNVSFDNVEKNGHSDQIFDAIRQWERARMTGAFTPEQKLRMENIENEYHLESIKEGLWNLFPYHVERFEHIQRIRQPGEPVSSVFEFDNPFEPQSPQFIMKLGKGSASGASKIILEINNFDTFELPLGIKPNQVLKFTGTGILELYDQNWNLLESQALGNTIPKFSSGVNSIHVDAKFDSSDGNVLNIEVKTIGEPEIVRSPANGTDSSLTARAPK